MNSSDGHHAAHPILKMSGTDINQSEKTMLSASFYVKKMPKEEPMVKYEMQDTFQNHDNNMDLSTAARKIEYYARTLYVIYRIGGHERIN